VIVARSRVVSVSSFSSRSRYVKAADTVPEASRGWDNHEAMTLWAMIALMTQRLVAKAPPQPD
jgi:hypothetical protein